MIKEYKWKFKIPSNQLIDSSNLGKATMIAQIHSRPEKGKNWKHYKKNNPFNTPSIGLHYTKRRDGLYVLLFYGLAGKPNMSYKNFKWKKIVDKKIMEDKWYEVFMKIKYAFDDKGFISLSLNEKEITPFNGTDYKFFGANMHNTTPNYFKFGLYRPWKNSTTQRIYFDDFRMRIVPNDKN